MLTMLLYVLFQFIDGSTTEEVESRAQSIARILATTTSDDVRSLDLASLQSVVDAAARTPGMAFARIISYDGRLLAEAGNPEALTQPFHKPDIDERLPDIYMAKATVVAAGANYGSVEIGLDLRDRKQEIVMIKRQSLLLAGLKVLAAALFSMAAGLYLVRRLRLISRMLSKINNEEYYLRLRDSQHDEVSEVAAGLDKLTERLAWRKAKNEQRIAELEEKNQLLLKKLAEKQIGDW